MTIHFEDGSTLKIKKEVYELYAARIARLFKRIREESAKAKDPFIYMAFIMACLRFAESGLTDLYIADPEKHFKITEAIAEKRLSVKEPLTSGNGYLYIDGGLEGDCVKGVLNLCREIYDKEGLERYIAFLCILKSISEKSLWSLDEIALKIANVLHRSLFV